MRKAVIFLALLLLSIGVSSCGGGGTGLNSPPGENPGVPSLVLLAPSSNVAQTNASITLSATVLDGNGAPIPGVVVTFTKLSAIGTLSTTLPVATDASGIARVNVYSSAPGFATVLAQVGDGFGFKRDKRSIFFTTSDSTNGLAFTPIDVVVDVDGNGNGIYNEASDLKVCEAAGDNVVKVRATVFIAGVRAPGYSVYLDTDYAALVSFPNTPFGTDTDADGDIDRDLVTTNSQGEAFTELTINCLVQNNERILNVYAYTNTIYVTTFNGYFSGLGAIPLFLQPVTITGITVTATPSAVVASGTSQIAATVNTSVGPISGIAVSFTTSCGTVSPTVAQTNSGGVATTTFTAPATLGACTVTARVGSMTGTAIVAVSTALSVTPASASVVVGGAVTFTITGGVPGYTITISNLSCTPLPASPVAASGGTFTVTTGAAGCVVANSPVTVTIIDSIGAIVTRTITITP